MLYLYCMFLLCVFRSSVSFSGNGFNVRSYLQFIVHVACFIRSCQDLLCFVYFVSISVFAVFLDSFCRPCCVCVLEFQFCQNFEVLKFWSFDNFLFLFFVFSLKFVFVSPNREQGLIQKTIVVSNIGQKDTFLENKITKNFTAPYSTRYLSVLHQNKALHNFYKWRQRPVARHMKDLDQGLESKCCFRMVYLFISFVVHDDVLNTSHCLISIFR